MAWIILLRDGDRVWAASGVLSEEEVLTAPPPEPAEGEAADMRPVIERVLIDTPIGAGGVMGPAVCWRFDSEGARNDALTFLTARGYSVAPTEVP